MSSPLAFGVSVVVCCHNSAARLSHTLRHISAQRVPEHVPWEVIVVDNASTDGTAGVAIEEWYRLGVDVPFRVVAEPTPGLVAARTKGLDEARFEFVVFCDDDNWLQDDYVRVVHEVMCAEPSIGVVGGLGAATFDTPPPAWFGRFERYFAVGSQANASSDVTDTKGYVYGAGFAIRRSMWQRVRAQGLASTMGGFPRGSDDIEACYLMRLAGARVLYDERLRFQHYIPPQRLRWDYLMEIVELAHETGVYVRPYKFVLDGARGRGSYVRPGRFTWLARSVAILPAWIRCRLRLGKRGVGSPAAFKERRLRGELAGWLTLRGRYAVLCDRIDATRVALLSARSASEGVTPANAHAPPARDAGSDTRATLGR